MIFCLTLAFKILYFCINRCSIIWIPGRLDLITMLSPYLDLAWCLIFFNTFVIINLMTNLWFIFTIQHTLHSVLYLFFSPFQNSFKSITSSLYNISYNYSYLEVEEFLIVFIISQAPTPIGQMCILWSEVNDPCPRAQILILHILILRSEFQANWVPQLSTYDKSTT